MNVYTAFKRVEGWELALCEQCNRACRLPIVRGFFVIISRLGDGVFWYSFMILLPLWYDTAALAASLHMLFVGFVCLLLYKYLKSRLVRQRPYTQHGGITRGTAPLDLHSFPSGHTLHAVAFTVVALAYYPHLAWMLVPFAAFVALSRVILGLHYPSDVLAGAVIGALVARFSFLILPGH